MIRHNIDNDKPTNKGAEKSTFFLLKSLKKGKQKKSKDKLDIAICWQMPQQKQQPTILQIIYEFM